MIIPEDRQMAIDLIDEAVTAGARVSCSPGGPRCPTGLLRGSLGPSGGVLRRHL